MRRRRWRRSIEAKPDEIETNSILHKPGLLVHAVTRVQKKNSDSCKTPWKEHTQTMAGQHRRARWLSLVL